MYFARLLREFSEIISIDVGRIPGAQQMAAVVNNNQHYMDYLI